ncbi:MAG: fused MFS/spermidine synthase [Candidatus Aureabacteria bacterium]|nr:fused MFS/spermidine synthase [Candidatus Auribacterota bacterium]
MVLFGGNELSAGAVLSSWLLWVAGGSFFASVLNRKQRNVAPFFLHAMVIIYLLLVIAIFFLIRTAGAFLGMKPGEIFGMSSIWLISFALLSLICFFNGMIFSFFCSAAGKAIQPPEKAVTKVYFAEAAGALFGGLAVSLFFIRFLNVFESSAVFFLLAGFAFLPNCASGRKQWLTPLVLITLSLLVFFNAGCIDRLSKCIQWQGFNLISDTNSIYGNIVVTGEKGQVSLFENGDLVASVPDRMSAEYSVHIPLLEHRRPVNVLMVGGGLGGGIEEALKHKSIEKIDYLEIDPALIKVAETYLGEDMAGTRVNIIIDDPRRYMRRSSDLYDVIIINVSDPSNSKVNRLFTEEFFSFAGERLNKGGVFSFDITVSENYINPEAQSLIACLYRTAEAVFSDVEMVPGEKLFFLSSNTRGVLTQDVSVIERRIKERNLDLKYVREYYLFDSLSAGRIKYFNDSVKEKKHVRLNTDFSPVCYYYAEMYWSTLFSDAFRKALSNAGKIKVSWFFSVPLAVIMLRFFIRGKSGFPLCFAVFTSGFAEIIFQIVIIIVFQVLYGYLYYRIGLLVTSFMGGLALGAFAARFILDKGKARKYFFAAQAAMCVYPLMLPLVFMQADYLRGNLAVALFEFVVFPALPAVAGFVGGVQFPLANRLYLDFKKSVGQVSGETYGFDVLGSFFGAFAASAVLVPVLGMIQVCMIAALLSASALIGICIYKF